MAETYKKLWLAGFSGVATASAPITTTGIVYTVPAATSTIVKSIRLVNTGTAAATIQLWHAASNATTPGDGQTILPAISIDAKGFAEFDGTLTMATGETLYAQGLPATITVTVYGVELT